MTLENMKDLLEKMKRQICKIEFSDGEYGTGFFCNIKHYPKNIFKLIKVLIITNYIPGKNDISIGKKIKFSINDENWKYEFLIDESRKIYTNQKYNITIIEIKDKDKFKEISFFDIDNKIFENKTKFYDIFKNQTIYLFHYSDGIVNFSNGLISSIFEDTSDFLYEVDYSVPPGSPAINSYNFN